MDTTNRKDFKAPQNDDRRVVGRRETRTGIIIENDANSASDLLIGFGGQKVTEEDYSIRLPPGERYQEMGSEITPTTEIRANFVSDGTGHATEFYN